MTKAITYPQPDDFTKIKGVIYTYDRFPQLVPENFVAPTIRDDSHENLGGTQMDSVRV